MKIAFLTTDNREYYRDYNAISPQFGTAPEAVLQGFARMPDVEIHVLSCVQTRMKAPAKLAPNIFFHGLHVPKSGWMRTLYFGCIQKTRRALKEIQPDIVHGQGTERQCAMTAVFSGHPNVVTIHGIMHEQARLLNASAWSFYGMAARLEKFCLRRTAGVFCNSAYTEASVRACAAKTWRVPNPTRSIFFETAPPAQNPPRCTLLNVGLVSPRKRQNELIEAAAELHREGLDFELHFIGEAVRANPYGRRFLDLVGQHGSFVKYLGTKSAADLIQAFDSSSAMVHVPSEESFGIVVAEALARNLKFFGFRQGGVIDIAGGVELAELFEDGDWTGLKNSVARWIRSGFPRPTSAAATMRERYHPESIARRHVEIYREVLSERS